MLPQLIPFLFLLLVPYRVWLEAAREAVLPTLSDYPMGKGTVGLVLYKIKDQDVYVLLGRERSDTHKKKALQFCELGGATVKEQSFMENLLREAYEESCGLANLKKEDVIEKGNILYIRKNDRDIFYVTQPCSFSFSSKDFVIEREKYSSVDDKECFLEKDDFQWIRLRDLFAYNTYAEEGFSVQNMDGQEMRIKLRRYFWDDYICKIKNTRTPVVMFSSQRSPNIANPC